MMRKMVIEQMDEAMAVVMRNKSPAERLTMLDGMWASARDMIQRAVQHEHPEWTMEQVNKETIRRIAHVGQ